MAYANTKALYIDPAQVSGSSDLTNFPVLIKGTYAGSGNDPDLRTTGNGGDIQNTFANGGASGSVTGPADFEITSDSGGLTQLDHEIVSYNATTGAIVLWVRVPTLSYNSTTTIYLQYNDSGVTTSQENVNGVWNANYDLVQHLDTYFADSTSNAFNGTDSGTATIAGQISNGRTFVNSESDKITFANSVTTLGAKTFSFWIKKATGGTAYQPIFDNQLGTGSNSGWAFFINQTNGSVYPYGTQAGSGAIVGYDDTTDICDNTWHYVAWTWDGTTGTDKCVLYLDGTSSSTRTAGLVETLSPETTLALGHNNVSTYLDGSLEEFRVTSNEQTADWIATEYNNQSSPSTFYSFTAASTFTPKIIMF